MMQSFKYFSNFQSSETPLKVMHFQRLRELHASDCNIAESVNVMHSLTSLPHILYYILMSLLSRKQVSFVPWRQITLIFAADFISLRLLSLLCINTLTTKEVTYKLCFLTC
jgi:hypothetical protein